MRAHAGSISGQRGWDAYLEWFHYGTDSFYNSTQILKISLRIFAVKHLGCWVTWTLKYHEPLWNMGEETAWNEANLQAKPQLKYAWMAASYTPSATTFCPIQNVLTSKPQASKQTRTQPCGIESVCVGSLIITFHPFLPNRQIHRDLKRGNKAQTDQGLLFSHWTHTVYYELKVSTQLSGPYLPPQAQSGVQGPRSSQPR